MSDLDTAGSAWQVPPSKYVENRPKTHLPAVKPSSTYVAMKDGCRIAVDVYLPEHAGSAKFPTIVIFTPYCRRFKTTDESTEPTPNAAKYRDFFVPYGYAVVVVDMRGTGASFGRRIALRSPLERQDSAEIADWVCARSWSNGVIGSTGISYLGAAACFLASTGHPAVKAIAPLFSVSDIYSEQLFPGGMMSRIWSQDYDRLMLALDHDDREKIRSFPYFNDPRLTGPQPVDEDPDGSLVRAAVAEHRDNFRLHDLMPEWQFREQGPLHAPDLTTDICSPFHYLLEGTLPEVAVYSVSGWYDGGGYANGAISRYLSRRGPNDRLLLGPWDHGARTNVSPWRARTAPEFSVMDEVLRFFDEHLMGLDTGIAAEQPVHYFCIHAEEWRSSEALLSPEHHTLFLADDGRLAESPAADASTLDHQVAFSTETGPHTRWARLGAHNVDTYYDDWQDRDRQMTNFTGPPLPSPLEIAGHIRVTLDVASSEPDAAIFVYASEVEADGAVRYITEGMLRAGHRKLSVPPASYAVCWPYRTFTRDDFKLLTAGEPAKLTFALLPVAWRLAAGSRLRISICGADERYFPQVPHGRPPRLTFTLGGPAASHVSIPAI